MKSLRAQAKFSLRAAPAALIAFVLLGCGKQGSPGNSDTTTAPASPETLPVHIFTAADPKALKLALVSNASTDFWKVVAAGVHRYERESGLHVDIRMPANGTVQEQNQILDDLVSQGYNGIAISVVSPDEQVSKINDAAKVTNVLCFDSDCPRSNRILYIGTDNFEAGKVLGRQIVRLLPNGGTIAVFAGSFSAENAKQRLSGVQAAIADHHIEIAARKEDGRNQARALTNVQEVIRSYPDLDLLCALWSYNGPAVATAIEGSSRKGRLFAAVFDGEQGTLDAIRSGVISCTVAQKPFQFGYLSSRWLHELAVKGTAVELPEDRNVDTGVRLIDSTSVSAFAQEQTEMESAH